MMRHVYIRAIISLIWLAAAVICATSGNMEMSVIYIILDGTFLYSAYALWKKAAKGKLK